jgi:hypothetical protein
VTAGDEGDEEEHRGAELRTYALHDLADNLLKLVLRVHEHRHELKAAVVSLQYNGDPLITPLANEEIFAWRLDRAGSLRELEQRVELGDDRSQVSAEAVFRARTNQTRIEIEGPTEQEIVRSGLALLQVVTANGGLGLEISDPAARPRRVTALEASGAGGCSTTGSDPLLVAGLAALARLRRRRCAGTARPSPAATRG